ncbi:MAG: methyltransferase domain-containing protein, partial [Thermoanaerobaculia bacterium]
PPGEVAGRSTLPVVLDIGAGSTDLIDAVAVREGIRPIALDFKIDHLLFDRSRSSARRVVGDARALPFRDTRTDAVTSAHFLHHFTPEENVGILSESLRVARIGVAVNDTRRHYAPLLFIQLIASLRLFGRITRFDAPGSVRRGYTLREVQEIADRVPAARRSIVRLFPFRFGILLWKR